MNDRFKFRVYHLVTGIYVDDSKVEILLQNNGILLFGNWHNDIRFVQSEYEIEQCTGLKDKNGKLIYEGDILLLYNNKFEVGNNNITVFFKCLTDKYTHIDPMDFDYNESEIIGNIHEQPEQKDVK